MPLDPVRVSDTRAWLAMASNDLRGSQIDLDADPPLFEDALFHCQQAVEKAFKAFLPWHDVPFRKTHNLEEIGYQCEQVDPTLKQLVDTAVPLTEYAWKFRYPGEPGKVESQEVEEVLGIARDVYEAGLGALPNEVRPNDQQKRRG